MKQNHEEAFARYGAGGGKELDERKSGQNIYPPKMASFGSSSRMIYLLSKEIKAFQFEEKLPTKVGGVANMDGYMEQDGRFVFVEAKCREPYGEKSKSVGSKYKQYYDYLSAFKDVKFTCKMKAAKEKSEAKMYVDFFYDGEEIQHFDIKQMLSHLLGISVKLLDSEQMPEKIDFLYLLFNPYKVELPDGKESKKLLHIYDETCKIVKAIDFKALFRGTLKYLQEKEGLGKEKDAEELTQRFSFQLCDQTEYKELLEK